MIRNLRLEPKVDLSSTIVSGMPTYRFDGQRVEDTVHYAELMEESLGVDRCEDAVSQLKELSKGV